MAKKTPKTLAQSLADAAVKIAAANHYLVGFDVESAAGISADDYYDAWRHLIDRELRIQNHLETGKSGWGKLAARRELQTTNLAFNVLAVACRRAHGINLSRG